MQSERRTTGRSGTSTAATSRRAVCAAASSRERRAGSWAFGACIALALSGCASRSPQLTPEAKQAVHATSGLCPTDIQQTRVMVVDRPDGVALVFETQSQAFEPEVARRAAELAEVLSTVHPAVNSEGQMIQHTAVPDVRLREVNEGVEIVLIAQDAGRRQLLRSQAEEHAALWRRGECPEMTDETVRAKEIKDWERVDR